MTSAEPAVSKETRTSSAGTPPVSVTLKVTSLPSATVMALAAIEAVRVSLSLIETSKVPSVGEMLASRVSLATNSMLNVSREFSKRLSSTMSTSMNPVFTPGLKVSFPFAPW